MESEPIWFKYATYGEDGFVNGVSDDAPEDVKEAYAKEQEQKQEYEKTGQIIPR